MGSAAKSGASFTLTSNEMLGSCSASFPRHAGLVEPYANKSDTMCSGS
jgi:hypothetical protein